jgi:tRNA(adenine34) deaminase
MRIAPVWRILAFVAHSLDEDFMAVALAEAEKGLAANELPIGAAVALEGKVLAAAHWRVGEQPRLIDHAELVALRAAEEARLLGRADRARSTLYTTLEPCLLCMGAAMSFLVGRVVYALEAPLDGASDVAEIWRPRMGHPSDGFPYGLPEVEGGVGRAASLALFQEFASRNPDAAWARAFVPPVG